MVFLVATALGAGGVAVIKSPRVSEAVRQEVIRLADQLLHLRVEMSHLQLDLLPPAVEVADLEIFKPGATEPMISVRHASVRPHPWPTAHGALVIGALEADGLRVDLTADEPPASAQPEGQDRALQLPVDIHRMRLTDAHFKLRRGDRWISMQGIDAAITPSDAGRQVTFRVTEGRAWLPGWVASEHPISFSTHLTAEVQGSIDHPLGVHIQQLSQNLPETQLNVHGDVNLRKGVQLQVTTQLKGQLAALSRAFPKLPALQGLATLEVDWRGTPQSATAYARFSCDELHVAHSPIGDVQLEGTVTPHSATLDSIRIGQADGGQVTGSGRIDFGAPYAVQLSARLHDASLPAILEAAGLPDAWVRMHLGGDMQLAGTLKPMKLELANDLETRNFAVLTDSFHHASAESMLSIANGSVRGAASIHDKSVELHGVEVSSGASKVTVDGTMAFDPNTGIDLRAVSDSLDLRDVGPIADVPFGGVGQVAATIEGPYDDLTVSGTVHTLDTQVMHYALGESNATLIFHMPILKADRITLLHGGGQITGSGRLHFDRAKLEVEGAFDADKVDLGTALATLGVRPDLARHFHAATSGRVLLDGPIDLPNGVMHFTAPRVDIDSAQFGAASVEATFGDSETPLAGTLTVRHDGEGQLACRVSLHPDGELDLQGTLEHVPIAQLAPLIDNAPLTGNLSANFAVHGPADAFDGSLTLRATALHAWGVNLEETGLQGTLTAGEMTLRGSILSGDAPVQGTLRIGPHMPYRVSASFAKLDVSRTWPLTADVALRVWGTLVADGDLTRPNSHQADAALSSLTGQWRAQQMVARAPSNIHYADGVFTFSPVRLANSLTSLQFGGTVPLDGPIDLNLQASGDVGGIARGIPQITLARGPFNVRLHVGGDLDAPTFAGEGSIDRASLRLLQNEQAVEKLRLRLTFDGRNVTVREGSAQVGGGALTFSGDATLGDAEDEAELNLQTKLQNVVLRPNPDLDTTLSGDLVLHGPLDDLMLKGKLKVEALRYTARMELDRLIPKKNGPLRATPTSGTWPVRLAVKLQAPNNVIISSNVLEAELQADLTVTGTNERPGLLGNVTPLWARARFRDNTFRVVRASIDFVDEYRIFTEFQVQAKTEACKIQADVTIQGNSDSYTVIPYGQDEHGTVDPQDVLACLQFGLRLHDFDGNQRNAAGFSDALPGTFDALWTVSGLDTKVKKLLPINVDELRLTSGWSSLSQRTTARILVGKELGQQLALKYSRSLDEYNDQQLSMEYRLNEKAIVQGSWLSARNVPVGDFGVDLRLHWELR